MLQAQVGRRVLLFDVAPDRNDLRQAKAAVPEIYIVDGGESLRSPAPRLVVPPASENSPYSYPSALFFSSTSPIKNQQANPHGTAGTHRVEGNYNGEWHAKSLDSALKAVQRASELYYDLAFNLPARGHVPAPIQLKFGPLLGSFRAYTALYAESQSPKMTSDVRVSVSAPLVVLP
jgi:hypothetical protein